MNQSLINELRALSNKIRKEIKGIEDWRARVGNCSMGGENYSRLLQADAACLNGIAVLVAANKR